MAYASVTYTSASGTTFALTNSSGDPISYLRQADISVTVNSVLQVQGIDYTFNSAGTSIVLASAVSGATVTINRLTDITDATVVYTAGSTLTAQDLNNADNQIRYGLQEFSDNYDALRSGTGDLQTLGGFIGSSEAWLSDNSHTATTSAIDNRVDSKIDAALTTDVVAGDSITITDNAPSSGQITVGVTDNSITSAKIQDGTIVNADINANAEIAVSKLADGSARQLLQTDAAGTGVEWTDNVDIPGTLNVTGLTTLDSTLSMPLGSAGTPSISFTGDPNTGIYSPGGYQVAISTAGVGRLFVDANGKVGLGTSTPGSYGLANDLVLSKVDFTLGITLENSNGSLIVFKSPSVAPVGIIEYQHSSSSFKFYTDSLERVTIASSGAHLQINGDRLKISTPKTPASASDTGTTGEICWDSNYIYVCTATNTWKRAALSTW